MAQVTVSTGWKHVSPPQSLASEDELAQFLNLLGRRFPERNILVRLLNDRKDELMIGIGPVFGIVTFTSADGSRVSTALGQNVVPAGHVVGFEWGRHWFEMGPDNLLPVATVRSIAEKWLADGTLDQSVKWETCAQPVRFPQNRV
jgi:hypothetical protein